MTKTQTKPENLPAIVAGDPIGAKLAQRGFYVERVAADPADAENYDAIDDALLDQLANEGYANVQDAFKAVAGLLGGGAFANKVALAETQEPFYIESVVQRIGGSYTGEDDWALKIVLAQSGELQLLTLPSNPGRDRFLYMTAFALHRYPTQKPLAALSLVERRDKPAFYIITPASLTQHPMRHATIEADPQTA